MIIFKIKPSEINNEIIVSILSAAEFTKTRTGASSSGTACRLLIPTLAHQLNEAVQVAWHLEHARTAWDQLRLVADAHHDVCLINIIRRGEETQGEYKSLVQSSLRNRNLYVFNWNAFICINLWYPGSLLHDMDLCRRSPGRESSKSWTRLRAEILAASAHMSAATQVPRTEGLYCKFNLDYRF